MEDPTKLDSSGSGGKGNENKTAISPNTTGDVKSGDFVAGTVIASRYRIVALVGKGGMGEVYKAEDIKLTQTVALKFLPDNYQNDSAALERFHAEVRNARQVSHVNVCRVFDIGEVNGRHFLSMEFVDGDDLSLLLTRVGRLSSERAVEISRQLCVGMEAIHKAGILHRDLKPANIIIDKKGVARITDFGIAGVEADMIGDNIRAGTPAYMSPEQITGKEVTTRSDIYSLGLVLYEIFTGKQAFVADNVPDLIKKHQTETPTNPSAHVKGIDPLVESVIAQCLEKDPNNRPQSALRVAMALPGGNPMQLALDAGQTPSPEMVAASPKKGALEPGVAFASLSLVFIGFGLLIGVSRNFFLHRLVPLEKSADVLRERSRELADNFGYGGGVDSVSGFDMEAYSESYVEYLKKNDQSADRWKKLAAARPAAIFFWYRTSPAPMLPLTARVVQYGDPKNVVPGMARVVVDTKGRLFVFEAVPLGVVESPATSDEFDWTGVFKEAGLDIENFQTVDPQWTPPQVFDQRRAYAGSYPDRPDIQIRIEMGAYRGKLTSFQIIEPWEKPPAASAGITEENMIAVVIILAIYFGVLFISGWLSVKNIRLGRSDLKGAFRIGLFMFAARMIVWAFGAHHTPSFEEADLLIFGLQSALYWAAMAGFMYLAFEPFLRKSSPERMIAWNRLLAGDWRDPLVGRDVLIGAAAASVLTIITVSASYFLPHAIGKPVFNLQTIANGGIGTGNVLAGIGSVPDIFFNELTAGLIAAFIISFLILFLGLLLRSKLLGTAAVLLVLGVVSVLQGLALGQPWFDIVPFVLGPTIFILVAARFGVVAFVSTFLFSGLLSRPVTTELSAWYAGEFIVYTLILIALAVYGFYTSTAGQKLWQGKFFEDGG